jgi:hypothetical protein
MFKKKKKDLDFTTLVPTGQTFQQQTHLYYLQIPISTGKKSFLLFGVANTYVKIYVTVKLAAL